MNDSTEANESPTAEAVPIPAPTPDPMSMKEVLAIPVMRRLWYAQIVSVFGDFVALFAVITYMTFVLHSNAQQVTGIQIAYMAPIAILGILSGVFVDRWPVKTTLVTSDLLRAGLILGLMAVHSARGFYLVLALVSIVSSFFSPAQSVALRTIVPLHGMRSAQSLMQQVMFMMRIVGGPLAIALVSFLGYKICYVIDSVSFVASASLIATLVLTIATKPRSAVVPAAPPASPQGSAVVIGEPTGVRRVLADMKSGAGFIVHHSGILFVILALAAAMFVLGCFGPLIAIYVRDTLHARRVAFGFTSMMVGIGMLMGINGLNAKAKKVRATTLVYCGLVLIAIGTLLLAALPYLWSSFPALFLVGIGAAAIIVPSQAMIAEETPPPMMGRVGSTVMSSIFGAQILGLLLSGVLTTHISIRAVFGLCTAMLVVLTIAGRLFMHPHDAAQAS